MEYNVECPKDMAELVSSKLQEAMNKGSKPFCTRLNLTATPEIAEFWIH